MCSIAKARHLLNTQLTTYRNWAGRIRDNFTGKLSDARDPMISVDAVALEMVMEDYGKCRAAMQEFCDRVDRGEVRSVKTYAKFKELLK